MNIEKMKTLKIGDVIQDLEILKNTKQTVFCVVTKRDLGGVVCVALKKEHKGHYPHYFRFNEYDCIKLSEPLKNITEEIFKQISNKNTDIESVFEKISQ